VLDRFTQVAGNKLACNMPTYLDMLDSSDKDIMVAYWMKVNGVLGKDVDVKTLHSFFAQVCSIEVNCAAAAQIAATLANNGISPSGKKCFDPKLAVKTVSIVFTCGMHDYNDKWTEQVGLSAKCSLSGCLLLVIPRVMGICIYSPRVDQKGISTRGMEFCKSLSVKFPTLKNFKF